MTDKMFGIGLMLVVVICIIYTVFVDKSSADGFLCPVDNATIIDNTGNIFSDNIKCKDGNCGFKLFTESPQSNAYYIYDINMGCTETLGMTVGDNVRCFYASPTFGPTFNIVGTLTCFVLSPDEFIKISDTSGTYYFPKNTPYIEFNIKK